MAHALHNAVTCKSRAYLLAFRRLLPSLLHFAQMALSRFTVAGIRDGNK